MAGHRDSVAVGLMTATAPSPATMTSAASAASTFNHRPRGRRARGAPVVSAVGGLAPAGPPTRRSPSTGSLPGGPSLMDVLLPAPSGAGPSIAIPPPSGDQQASNEHGRRSRRQVSAIGHVSWLM